MKKALIIALLMLAGCHRPHVGKSQPSAVSKFSLTPLPVPPDIADPLPTKRDIDGAKTEAEASQANVEQVLTMAKASPAAQDAVGPLTSADTHLTATRGYLDDASKRIAELGDKLAASEDSHAKTDTILKADIAALQKAASVDAAANAKTVQALQSENEELKSQALRRMQFWLYCVGTLLCLAGGMGIFLRFYIGFAPGAWLGSLAGVLGFVLIGFAGLLPKIQEYAEIGLIAGLAVAFIVGIVAIWHAFRHQAPEAAKQ